MSEKNSVELLKENYNSLRERVRRDVPIINPVDEAKLRYLEDISMALAMIYDELREKNEN